MKYEFNTKKILVQRNNLLTQNVNILVFLHRIESIYKICDISDLSWLCVFNRITNWKCRIFFFNRQKCTNFLTKIWYFKGRNFENVWLTLFILVSDLTRPLLNKNFFEIAAFCEAESRCLLDQRTMLFSQPIIQWLLQINCIYIFNFKNCRSVINILCGLRLKSLIICVYIFNANNFSITPFLLLANENTFLI